VLIVEYMVVLPYSLAISCVPIIVSKLIAIRRAGRSKKMPKWSDKYDDSQLLEKTAQLLEGLEIIIS